MIEQYKHLFTPVTEVLPEINMPVFCIDKQGEMAIDIIIEGTTRFRSLYTHWLDLSKLTTKERAVNEAVKSFEENVFAEGWNDHGTPMGDLCGKTEFIKQIKEGL